MQAAIGCAQLKKVDYFAERRRHNYDVLFEGLKDCQDKLILPTQDDRNKIVQHLESKGIQTRMLFAGNIVKQPCFDSIREDKDAYRVVGELDNTERIMNSSFWIGVYPGMTDEMLEKMIREIRACLKRKKGK